MKIHIDGAIITDKKVLFQQLKSQIDSDIFYGNNLDALWDTLSYANQDVTVTIVNHKELVSHLGDYAESLLTLFQEIKKLNSNSKIEFK